MTPELKDRVEDALVKACDTMISQKAQITELKDKNAVMQAHMTVLAHYVGAVHRHNVNCEAECGNGRLCGFSEPLKRKGLRCEGCPVEFKVKVMPTQGNA